MALVVSRGDGTSLSCHMLTPGGLVEVIPSHPEGAARVEFTVASTNFQPRITLSEGSTASVTWLDNSESVIGTGVAPSLTAGSSSFRTVYMDVDVPSDVVTINLGHSNTADAGLDSLPSSYNRPGQGVASVSGLTQFPNLQHFLAANTPLGGHVDVSGLSNLTHLDCYHANVSSVDLTGCTSLVRLVMEQTDLTELDLNPVAANLHDLRGAEQQGGTLTLTPLTQPLANLYHFCVRSQTLINLPTPEQLPAIQQYWVWRDSLNIDEVVIRSSRPLDSVRLARDAHPGTVNVVRHLDCAGQTWASTFPGEPEQRIDAWSVGMETVDITGMGPVDAIRLQDNSLDTASVDHVLSVVNAWGTSGGTLLLAGNAGPTDLTAVTALQGRGWTVTNAEPVNGGGGEDPEEPQGVIWEDDFERADTTGWSNVANGWREPVGLGSASSSSPDLSIAGGDLVFSTDINGYHYATCQPDVAIPSDVIVEADIEIGDDFDADSGYFGLCLRVNSDGTDGLKCMVAGLTNRPRNGTLTTSSGSVGLLDSNLPSGWATPGLHTISVQISGDTMGFYVDGVLMSSRTDAAYSTYTGTGVGICGEPRDRHWRAIRVRSVPA